MSTLTIRNLDEIVKKNLRLSAAKHGCSMEEEARRILRRALVQKEGDKGLGTRIHERFSTFGGVDLELPDRSTPRPAPDFTAKKQ
jgi:plasmid stability protein